MPRRPTRTVPVIVVPGWQGSGAGHWQTWLAEQLAGYDREVRYPSFASVDEPDLDNWLAGLHAAMDGLPDDGFDVITHSLGAVLWLHHASRRAQSPSSPRASRVLLVAPPSPTTAIAEIAAFFPPPTDIDALRAAADGTVLVAGDDDPYLPEGIADAYARPLKIATTVISGGGHLNVESGYGEWPAALDWSGRDNLAFF